MLNKPLNIAHAKDRQAQKCIKKGLFDSAVGIERSIVENLEVCFGCFVLLCQFPRVQKKFKSYLEYFIDKVLTLSRS